MRIASVLFQTSLSSMTDNSMVAVNNMETALKNNIFGQDSALTTISHKVRAAKLGLHNTNKPMGTFLFYGPTGVGKTEMAKQIALGLGMKLVRIDMSEYSESHSVSRFVGSPPGYVGYDQGGLLTDSVYHNQHCVLLLDEIEKAHRNVHNMLLQVMDYGVITDSTGREVNFTHSIIIMTTNLGSQAFDKGVMGFTGGEGDASVHEIEQFFSPEFRNRLSAIIKFNQLTPLAIEMIVKKVVSALAKRLKARGIVLDIDNDVIQHIVHKNRSVRNGARFLETFVDDHLVHPITDLLMTYRSCKNVSVRMQGDQVMFAVGGSSNTATANTSVD
jgi:ATP-dependent Clp protease ATP-binding subunit ClpA